MSNGNRQFLSSFEIKISRTRVLSPAMRGKKHVRSPQRVPIFLESRCCGLIARVIAFGILHRPRPSWRPAERDVARTAQWQRAIFLGFGFDCSNVSRAKLPAMPVGHRVAWPDKPEQIAPRSLSAIGQSMTKRHLASANSSVLLVMLAVAAQF
jgi:hypothetical protein